MGARKERLDSTRLDSGRLLSAACGFMCDKQDSDARTWLKTLVGADQLTHQLEEHQELCSGVAPQRESESGAREGSIEAGVRRATLLGNRVYRV